MSWRLASQSRQSDSEIRERSHGEDMNLFELKLSGIDLDFCTEDKKRKSDGIPRPHILSFLIRFSSGYRQCASMVHERRTPNLSRPENIQEMTQIPDFKFFLEETSDSRETTSR